MSNVEEIVVAMVGRLIKVGFYYNEVYPAIQFVTHMMAGKRTGVVAWPMQSGKTNIIACIFYILKALIPDVQGVFICANDQVDLRRQNGKRLENIPDFEVLSRTDRKQWKKYSQNPVIVFYDESHFGDGIDMTVNEFLEKNHIKHSPEVAFCCVSATPFSSLNCLDFQIWPDMKALETAGYNSPELMLNSNRIQVADKLFDRSDNTGAIVINENANVYKHILEIIARPVLEGYGMVRATYEEARALEVHLKKKFQEKILVKHWNMHARDFSPESFFSKPSTGVFTLVMVQHKARMGNTIDTKYFEFFYEHSTGAHLDTILQSFIGRACGFGKQGHKVIVYSNPKMAEAYSLLISSKGDGLALLSFRLFCIANYIKPATRATFHSNIPEFLVEIVAERQFEPGPDTNKKIRKWIKKITSSGEFKEGFVRTLSKTAIPVRKQGRRIFHPDCTDNSLFCGTEPGDWSAFIYDNYKQDSILTRKDWNGIIVKIARRTNKRNPLTLSVGPTEHSLHSTFSESNA